MFVRFLQVETHQNITKGGHEADTFAGFFIKFKRNKSSHAERQSFVGQSCIIILIKILYAKKIQMMNKS